MRREGETSPALGGRLPGITEEDAAAALGSGRLERRRLERRRRW